MIDYREVGFMIPIGKLRLFIYRNKGIISRSGRMGVRMETVDETFQALVDETFQALVRDLSSLNNICDRAMRSKVMFGMKSDCSISRYEEDYLISKGWDERIFKD